MMYKSTVKNSFIILVESHIHSAFSDIRKHIITTNNSHNKMINISGVVDIAYRKLLDICSKIITPACVNEMHSLKNKNYLTGDTSEERFRDFINIISKIENQKSFFEKYPVIESQIKLQINQFKSSFIEFIDRLANDYHDIKKVIFSGKDIGKLYKIEFSGDIHCEGRGVFIVTFKRYNDISKVVYKPRSMSADKAFYNLINWLFDHGYSYEFKSPIIIEQSNYAWSEFIEHKFCDSETEISHYYHRLGALLAVMKLVNGSDIHAENIIAYKGMPVIIDLECILAPYFGNDVQTNNPSKWFVTDACFLPKPHGKFENSIIDISAFLGRGGVLSDATEIAWENEGTDAMTIKCVKQYIAPFNNRPSIFNHEINPLDYCDIFISGFIEMYSVIMKNRKHIQDNFHILDQFKHVRTRVIFRNTAQYVERVSNSYHPFLLHEIKNRHNYFREIKSTAYNEFVAECEISDLTTGNIPYFFTCGNHTALYNSNGGTISVPVIMSGFERMKQQLSDSFSKEDCREQVNLIRASFEVAKINYNYKISDDDDKDDFHYSGYSHIKDILTLLLKLLSESKIENRNRLFWPCIKKNKQDVFESTITDINLYDGVSGIGLIFACANKVLPNPEYYEMAHKCANSLTATISEKDKDFYGAVGAFMGIGGLIYANYYFYNLLGRKQSKIDIDILCDHLIYLIPQDVNFDIISGVAGCLAVLIRCRTIIDPLKFEMLSKMCVDRLLDQYPSPDTLPGCMKNEIIDVPLLGFAHGLSGIIWALDKYDQIYPDYRNIRSWIEQALSYERSYFSEENGWPDLRKNTSNLYTCHWCHGSVGIGLSKMDLSKSLHNKKIDREISSAVKCILENGFGGSASLCHGSLGSIEFLLVKNYDISELVKNVLNNILKKSSIESKSNFMPGIMTGTSGSVYMLMRLLFPESVPSILLLQ